MDDSTRGACANHPDRPASITCKHCGSYACSECTIEKLWGETLCAACDARGAAQYPIPWDRSAGVGTFIATTRNVFSELRLLFEAFPEGSVARAFGYAGVIGVGVVGTMAIVGSISAKRAVMPLSWMLAL